MSITVVRKNTYYDSVSLMSVSTRANQLDGVHQAFVAMATEMNKEVLRNLGLLTAELDAAGGGDLMIVLDTADGVDDDATLVAVDELFTAKKRASGQTESYRTIDAAARNRPGANLAVIAVAGTFAAREARKALENDLHAMVFSDNVSIEDEVALKTLAHDKGLLMMGPDCGTAIIDNVALCFGNAVRPGTIGIVAASGTGSQEVSVRVHALGGGVSQLIGTGGRDLSEQVGGVMMIDGLRALAKDAGTDVIVLISKPPAPSVEQKVLAEIAGAGKPVVVCFIGGSQDAVVAAGGTFAANTDEASRAAVRLAGIDVPDETPEPVDVEAIRAKLTPEQRYIRGLFCGGTLCDEAMYAALEVFPDVYSNIQKDPERKLDASSRSVAHTFLDFGDDDFTNGRPHPMIDPTLRIARLLEEAKDPEVGVIVMDFILGFGSHEDPVGVLLPAIAEAKELAAADGRHLEIVGYVLGTDRDRPELGAQLENLRSAGVTVAASSASTGRLARAIVRKGDDA
ncbi:acyl-CoA synthetase FdrA [Kribbella sp. GL6]|uniref:acyl-CoA synthetase FdrA n=1 Tax=Kribbella sp. GL6 TaxID=3419765 RepID=UPI003D029C59